MNIRALALDLDGTLLSADYAMSDRSVAAVSAFRASGRAVVVATGRARRSGLPWARRLGGVSAMVCHNGAAVYDFGAADFTADDGRLISDTVLPVDLVRRVIALSRRLDLHFHTFAGDDWYFERWGPGTALYEARSGFAGNPVNFDTLPKMRFHKAIFIASTNAELKEVTEAARDVCAGEATLVVFERAGSELVFDVIEETKLLLLSGEPFDEPIVGYGPFVMNSEAEIRTAIEDYRSGKMGHISVPAG